MAEETKNTTVTKNNDAENQQTDTNASREQTETKTEDTQVTENVNAQLAEAQAEIAKLKNSLSKANSEAANYKKELRAKQTVQEQEDEAKREAKEQQEAYVKDLEQFKTRTLAKERYLMQGMTVEMADKAAQAEVEGDMDTLATIQKQHTDAALKAAKAEWQKSIPEANRGTGNTPTMTKEEIFAIKDPVERQKAIAANMALFN